MKADHDTRMIESNLHTSKLVLTIQETNHKSNNTTCETQNQII